MSFRLLTSFFKVLDKGGTAPEPETITAPEHTRFVNAPLSTRPVGRPRMKNHTLREIPEIVAMIEGDGVHVLEGGEDPCAAKRKRIMNHQQGLSLLIARTSWYCDQ
jgi:hypothetical protein